MHDSESIVGNQMNALNRNRSLKKTPSDKYTFLMPVALTTTQTPTAAQEEGTMPSTKTATANPIEKEPHNTDVFAQQLQRETPVALASSNMSKSVAKPTANENAENGPAARSAKPMAIAWPTRRGSRCAGLITSDAMAKTSSFSALVEMNETSIGHASVGKEPGKSRSPTLDKMDAAQHQNSESASACHKAEVAGHVPVAQRMANTVPAASDNASAANSKQTKTQALA